MFVSGRLGGSVYELLGLYLLSSLLGLRAFFLLFFDFFCMCVYFRVCMSACFRVYTHRILEKS